MNTAARDEAKIESFKMIDNVIAEGLLCGYWTDVVKVKSDNGDNWCAWKNVIVKTADGLAFSIRTGSYDKPGMISADVAVLNGPHGINISPKDANRYDVEIPTANVSCKKDAAAIAKQLFNRVIGNPEAIEIATKTRDMMVQRLAQHAELRRHIAKLESMGFKVNNLADNNYSSATLYSNTGASPSRIEVTANGYVRFEMNMTLEGFSNIAQQLDAAAYK